MKKLFITILFLLVSKTSYAHIRIALTDWCPYSCNTDDKTRGFVVEILEDIFDQHGVKLVHTKMPWTRALKAMKLGTQDLILATNPPEYPDGIFPKEEVGVYYNYFFVRKSSKWKYTGVESLNDVRLGGVQGYTYPKIMGHIKKFEGAEKVQLITGENLGQRNMAKLLHSHIDTYVEDHSVGKYNLFKIGASDKIKIAGKEGSGAKLYIAFSPRYKNAKMYAKLFDRGIVKLRKSGKLSKILERYGLKDWK